MEENIRLKQAGSLPMATEAVESETILAVDASGNMNRVPVDAAPAENSNKLIKSGGVFAAIASAITATIASIKTWVGDGFAKIDGWYSTLVSGAAENLVGRGSVPAEYTFRTSGGTADLGTGNAQIHKILGKSLVWNQLVDTDTTEVAAISGHKYLTVIGGTATIVTSDGTAISVTGGTDKVYDLTLMFGAGDEPSTVAAFTALYPLINDYDYTATPQIINVTASGIKTTGFNQWDEQWINASLDYATGNLHQNNDFIASKNYIPVFPNTKYYRRIPATYGDKFSLCRAAFYDENYNYIGGPGGDPDAWIGFEGESEFTTPINARYMRFSVVNSTYNNDICINLYWSGYRNGEYEPYEEHILYFNGEDGSLATVTGKLNGEGESVTIFPEGPKSAGTAHDEYNGYVNGYLTKGTKRIFKVDLGNLEWSMDTVTYQGQTIHAGYAVLDGKRLSGNNIIGNLLCTKYQVATITQVDFGIVDKAVAGCDELGRVWVFDSDYNTTDASAFTAAMRGVELYYEAETPEEYTLDEPIPANYYVNDFGTEERLPADTASVVAAPILYDVQYAMNAVDTLRRLPVNYISKASMDNFTTELASKLGTAMNATIAITPTYDSEHEEYDYEITITPNEP